MCKLIWVTGTVAGCQQNIHITGLNVPYFNLKHSIRNTARNIPRKLFENINGWFIIKVTDLKSKNK